MNDLVASPPDANSTDIPVFIGGLAGHDDDCLPLQKALNMGPFFVRNIPLYRGEIDVDRKELKKMDLIGKRQVIRQVEDKAAEKLADELLEIYHRIAVIIAHSRGTWLWMRAAKIMTKKNPRLFDQHDVPVALLATPTKHTSELTKPMHNLPDPLHQMDPNYRSLRGKMDEETYVAMMERQQPHFIGAMKVISPIDHPLSVEEIQATLRKIHKKVEIFVATGELDDFRDDDNLADIIRNRFNITTELIEGCGHFLHLECVEIIKKMIWRLVEKRRERLKRTALVHA
ncbi:MAG: hypothetical protein HOO67_03030 [Candidatus Peribacteraceae bacterium]|nr:hypothetical protein [Candidatus Peribacteraceae bacterium]